MITSYISCACNRMPHTADWGNNGLICYAACNAVVIYDPHSEKIGKTLQTLHQHKSNVSLVQWIKSKNSNEIEILSSSIDGYCIIWSKINDDYQSKSVIEVNNPINITTYLYLSDDITIKSNEFPELIVCTGSIEGDIKVWYREKSGDIKLSQELTFEKKLTTEACLTFLSKTKDLLLAVALENSCIELYCSKSSALDKIKFIKTQTLVGHEDWVRCMDFCNNSNREIFLASGSQDTLIRLWKIAVNVDSKLDELEMKKKLFKVNEVLYNVTLDSVLSGHEGWVYGVHWYYKDNSNKEQNKSMKLLSGSLDKSMLIWELDPTSKMWTETVRVGDVGGNSAGFYGCKFGPYGQSIMGHSYQGSLHLWQYIDQDIIWVPKYTPTGHFSEVVDLCWDPRGRFLITASTDQTTRIHAPVIDGKAELWHEMGRPQIHGYDMACLTILKPDMFASGADEKVIRIFTAPNIFKSYLMQIADVSDFNSIQSQGATVPALGLTNKAVFDNDEIIKHTQGLSLDYKNYVPPTEEDLMQNTLWPELQKLYGHGYEIFALSARLDGLLLASACKSTSPEHAAIILWDTQTWRIKQKLLSHQLTVTQIAFSPNGKYLISSSRDRMWSLFEENNDEYKLVITSPKKGRVHSRIIWCCAWTHDSQFFATGSRDGKIGVWSVKIENVDKLTPILILDIKNTSITAVAFAPIKLNNFYILVIGFESGQIEIQTLNLDESCLVAKVCLTLNTSKAHHKTVKRLAFRPPVQHLPNILQLASCGSDHIVKIYNIYINDLFNS